MKVLVACEESQTVCKAFRERGHNAFSCDLQECSGGKPEWHIKDDCIKVLYGDKWDMVIAHPPCTYLSRMNFLNLYRHGKFNEERYKKGLAAVDFFMKIYNAPVDKICVENPIPFSLFKDLLPKNYIKINPFEFGENYSKATLLWLKGLPPLIPTCHVLDYVPLITVNNSFLLTKNIAEQSKLRSKTFYGIACAMAQQWSNL